MGLVQSNMVSRMLHHATGGLDNGNCNSMSKDDIHMILATKRAKLLCWAFVLKREVIGFFLDCLEIRFRPRNTQKPDVERRSPGSKAQSASQKPFKVIEELGFG